MIKTHNKNVLSVMIYKKLQHFTLVKSLSQWFIIGFS